MKHSLSLPHNSETMNFRILITIFTLLTINLSGQKTSLSFTYGVLPVEHNIEFSFDEALQSKINKEMLKLGPAESIPNYSIVLTPRVFAYSYDISATAPPFHTADMEISLRITDFHNTVTLCSYDIELKAAGRSQEKAMINAIRDLDFGDKKFSNFLKDTEEQIKKYLKEKSASIISRAEAIQDHKKFLKEEEAQITLSRLGMLLHYDIEQEKVNKLILEITNSLKENDCDAAKRKAKLCLDSEKFDDVKIISDSNPNCDLGLEDYGEKYQRYLDRMEKQDSLRSVTRPSSDDLETDLDYLPKIKTALDIFRFLAKELRF